MTYYRITIYGESSMITSQLMTELQHSNLDTIDISECTIEEVDGP